LEWQKAVSVPHYDSTDRKGMLFPMQPHVPNSLLKKRFGGKDTYALHVCGGVLSLVLRQGIPLTGSSHGWYWKLVLELQLVLEVVTVGIGVGTGGWY
jgi:hypothetical protein